MSPVTNVTYVSGPYPLGEEEIRLTKKNYGWPEDATFRVPEEAVAHVEKGMGARGKALRSAWMELFSAYEKEHPELAKQLYQMQHRQLPEGWDAELPTYAADEKGIASTLCRKYTWLTAEAHLAHSETEFPSVDSKRRRWQALSAIAHLVEVNPPTEAYPTIEIRNPAIAKCNALLLFVSSYNSLVISSPLLLFCSSSRVIALSSFVIL